MMEVYRTPSKEIQDIILANVTYEAVIDGLNGYFASEPRNDYITVKMVSDNRDSALYEAEAWADILISWLRTKHGIFYYPGMEATEEDIWKNVMNCIRQEPSQNGFDLPRACQDLIENLKKREVEIKSKESGIEDLKEHITLLEADLKKAKMEKEKLLIEVADRDEEIESLQKNGADLYLEHRRYIIKSIMNDIRQEASRNGFDLPEKVDGGPLSIERTFHDLLELLKKRTTEIKESRKKHWNDLRDIYKMLGRDDTYDNTDDFAKAVKARAECIKIALGEKSDINKLVRDYCTKNNIIAPSPYFSDKACVEYLFSVIKLDRKDRAAAILYDLYHDIFHKDCNQFTYEDIATKILDRVLETEDLLHKSVDSVNKECKATGRLMVEDYSRNLKTYILKGIKKLGYPCDGLETKSVEEIVDWIIMMDSDVWVNSEIRNLRGQIKRLKGLINAMNEEVGDM